MWSTMKAVASLPSRGSGQKATAAAEFLHAARLTRSQRGNDVRNTPLEGNDAASLPRRRNLSCA